MTPLERRRKNQTPLLELADAITLLAGARSADDIIDIIRSSTRALVGAEGISIVRREDGYCHYIEEDAVSPLWKGQRFPMTNCISGWAMLNEKTAVVPDISVDERIPQEVYAATFVKSLVMVPVFNGVTAAGAIGAYWATEDAPGEFEIKTLETLARAAATAMENVRLMGALSDALRMTELARDELKHRVKNAYMGAQALAGLSLPRELSAPFRDRIGSLSRVHDLLDNDLEHKRSVSLRALLETVLCPYSDERRTPFHLDGENIDIDTSKAVPLGLAINELATNALKHGALSVPTGTVFIRWVLVGEAIEIVWKEEGGPIVRDSEERRSGTSLIERVVTRQLGGSIEHELELSGVRCTIVSPMSPRTPD